MMPKMIVAGSPGSPYSRKLLAAMRYKRIPYELKWVAPGGPPNFPSPRVPLLPVLYVDGGDELLPWVDTTPILRELDKFSPARPMAPANPALAFINALIEDFADEWLTKAMFHYRWTGAADIDKSAQILPHWFGPPMSNAELAAKGQEFANRQIERLSYVGSNPATATAIEASFGRVLGWFESHLMQRAFLFGDVPFSADMAFFGQLSQLVLFDPTPRAIAERDFPRVIAWTIAVEDLSGHDGRDDAKPEAMKPLLSPLLEEIGLTYVPLLLANADALERSLGSVETEICGRPWIQVPFPYQGKCLAELRAQYATLAPEHREVVLDLLEGTGCGALIAPRQLP